MKKYLEKILKIRFFHSTIFACKHVENNITDGIFNQNSSGALVFANYKLINVHENEKVGLKIKKSVTVIKCIKTELGFA